ncbi:MAG TPA: Bax inhibitor-1 family protein [Candidatus Xenobia bacterium]|jgi:hypothetical protein
MSQATLERPGTVAPVESLGREAKGSFLIKTYAHLYGAVVVFAAIDYCLFVTGLAVPIARAMLSTSWLLVLGGFMILSWMARNLSRPDQPLPIQYGGLLAYVAGQALMFVPLLFIAEHFAPGAISAAIYATLIGFLALTAIVALTGQDFSFLRGALAWGGFVALGVIVCACLFHMSLGTWFDMAMIGLAGAGILYDTSKVLRNYGEEGYVSASLQLFASLALMLWYVIRLFTGSRRS